MFEWKITANGYETNLTVSVLTRQTEAGTTLYIAPCMMTETSQHNASRMDGFIATAAALGYTLTNCSNRSWCHVTTTSKKNIEAPSAISLTFGSNSTLSALMLREFQLRSLIGADGEPSPEDGACVQVYLYRISMQIEAESYTSKYDILMEIDDLLSQKDTPRWCTGWNNSDTASVTSCLLKGVGTALFSEWRESPQLPSRQRLVERILRRWKNTRKSKR